MVRESTARPPDFLIVNFLEAATIGNQSKSNQSKPAGSSMNTNRESSL